MFHKLIIVFINVHLNLKYFIPWKIFHFFNKIILLSKFVLIKNLTPKTVEINSNIVSFQIIFYGNFIDVK